MEHRQRYYLELNLNYEGKVYDGDPTDLDQLAKLEEYGLAEALEQFMSEFFESVENVTATVSAVRPTRKTDK